MVKIKNLPGANMDIDLVTPPTQIEWQQSDCPWNDVDGGAPHRCAVKNISICPFFCGIKYLDQVQCSYPNPNPHTNEFSLSEVIIQGPSIGNARDCEPILRTLPDWFGIETAIQEYVVEIDAMPTFLAQKENKTIGFLTLNVPNPFTAEIHVMAILSEWHHQGIGRGLVLAAEKYLLAQGGHYIQVKTLSASHPDENYARTRKFYLALGFVPLQEFPDLWGVENPCLQLIKKI
jgi:GNAT superfamily N-acetyltransferase